MCQRSGSGGSPSLTEQFTYRGSQLAQSVVVSGTTTYTDTYVYSQHGMPLELLRTTTGGTNRYWYQRDGLGNVVDQYAYDLWGKPTLVQETVPQQLRYQGYWYDNELGWYWLTTRSYDPSLERFLQPDPSETDGLFSYVYVGDDPVDMHDPSGFAASPMYCDSYCSTLIALDNVLPVGMSVEQFQSYGGSIVAPLRFGANVGSAAAPDWMESGQIQVDACSCGDSDLPGPGSPIGAPEDPPSESPSEPSSTLSAEDGGTYLDPAAWGDLYEVEVEVSVEGIDQIESHLSGTHLNEPANDYAPNVMMIGGLQESLAAGEPVSGSYAVFYTHEIFESELMDMGMPYDEAHDFALRSYGVSPFTVYDRSVILKYPAEFSRPYKAFWKIGQ